MTPCLAALDRRRRPHQRRRRRGGRMIDRCKGPNSSVAPNRISLKKAGRSESRGKSISIEELPKVDDPPLLALPGTGAVKH